MPLTKTDRILKEMLSDKRAGIGGMAAKPTAKTAASGAKNAAAGATTQASGQAAQTSGGSASVMGQLGGAGNPLDMVKGVFSTEAGENIKQRTAKIDEIKKQIDANNLELKVVEQQIDQAKYKLKEISDDLDQAKTLEEQGQPQDIPGLEQQQQDCYDEITQLEQRKEQIKEETKGLEEEIGIEKEAISQLRSDRWKELKLNAVGLVPGYGTAIHGMEDKKTASKEGKIGAKIGQQEKAPTQGAKTGGIRSKFSGITSWMSRKGNSSGEKTPAGSIILILATILGGGFLVKYSGGISSISTPTTLIALSSLILFIIAIVVMIKTKGNRGLFTWLIIIMIFTSSFYMFGSRTAPYAVAAYQEAGGAKEIAENAADTGQKGISALIKDAVTSYRTQMAAATGQRIEGEVDQSVKEEVGVEILPPYLPNPKKTNEDEAIRGVEFSARIKAFDPKTPVHVSTACLMETEREAASISRAATSSLGPNMNGEPQQRRPTNITGYSFVKDVTCYPTITSCGEYIITLSSQADNLRTDAQMQNYIIDKEILDTQLVNYVESTGNELKSESQVASAINRIYGNRIGQYKSVSQKGSIKVVMVTEPVPLIGIDHDTELKLQVGVENMLDGWVMGVNKVEITIPGYFTPVSGFCNEWQHQGEKLVLSDSYLRSISFSEVTKGQQKVFPSCHLIPTGSYQLAEPTEATFLALVEYNYLVQEQYNLQVMNATGGRCIEQEPIVAEPDQDEQSQENIQSDETA